MSVMLGETVLQSPYSVDFNEEQVKEQTQELFEKDEKDMCLIHRIGIEAYSGQFLCPFVHDEDCIGGKDYNVLLELRCRGNYKTGYWELVFSHTKTLGIVPKDMRTGRSEKYGVG